MVSTELHDHSAALLADLAVRLPDSCGTTRPFHQMGTPPTHQTQPHIEHDEQDRRADQREHAVIRLSEAGFEQCPEWLRPRWRSADDAP